MILDLIDHQPVGAATNGLTARFPLQPMSGATFHVRVLNFVIAGRVTAESAALIWNKSQIPARARISFEFAFAGEGPKSLT